MAIFLVAITFLGVVRLYVLGCHLNVPHREDEPPLVPQPFPIVGHLIRMIIYGNKYYSRVRYVKFIMEDSLTLYVPDSLQQTYSTRHVHFACTSIQDIRR
jgi:hypothetical protein